MLPFIPEIFPVLLVPDLIALPPTWKETPLTPAKVLKHFGLESAVPSRRLSETSYRFKPTPAESADAIHHWPVRFPDLEVADHALLIPTSLELWFRANAQEGSPVYLRVQQYRVCESPVPSRVYRAGVRVIPDYYVVWFYVNHAEGVVEPIRASQVPSGVDYRHPVVTANSPKSPSVFVFI